MIFYFTATGNSLSVAKKLDDERYSIPQELKKRERRYRADAIGIVSPTFELEVPEIVREFIQGSEFETDYFYIIFTYGMHHGGLAERTQAWLQGIGKSADYINTILMWDNALPVFNMEDQARLDPEKKVPEHIAALRADVDARRREIQPATDEEKKFYQGFLAGAAQFNEMMKPPLYRVTEACVGCGTCARVCPRGCVRLEEGRPVHDYADCIQCMACIHACPRLAVRFATVPEPNPARRYRNPEVSLSEIIRANRQG